MLIEVYLNTEKSTHQLHCIGGQDGPDDANHRARTHARVSHQGRKQFRRPEVDYGKRSRDAKHAHVCKYHGDPCIFCKKLLTSH